MKKIAVVLALGVAFCLVLCSVAEAISNNWAKNNLKNKNKAVRIPIWQITQDGSRNSVNWVNHTPNPRFAVYDVNGDNAGGSDFYVEDLVLDTETGLVWARDANYGSARTWQIAIQYCASDVNLGNRKGWRLPTIEEITSLMNPSLPENDFLPIGHPFINVQVNRYWSSTTYESDSTAAWSTSFSDGVVTYNTKAINSYQVWPVRGGNGYASGGW